MCIAICKPAGIIIPLSHLHESFEYNPDGAGFMYAENNELHIEKGFMDIESFLEAYEPHKEKAAALHFRIRTHGATDPANTHPFRVGHNMGMIHNGIIAKIDTSEDSTKSDTYHFNEKFLTQIYKRDSRFAYKEHFKALIKEFIGFSKLVFLNNKGHYSIINEKAGTWDGGVWYSNNSYKPYTAPVLKGRKVTPPLALVGSSTPSKGRTYTIGTRVTIDEDVHGRWEAGAGSLRYFSGGLMVGVLRDDTGIIDTIHMSYINFEEEEVGENIPFEVGFNVGDWVQRTDSSGFGTVGEVQGTAGKNVIVKWLDANGLPAGPDYMIRASKLETFMAGFNAIEYMQ